MDHHYQGLTATGVTAQWLEAKAVDLLLSVGMAALIRKPEGICMSLLVIYNINKLPFFFQLESAITPRVWPFSYLCLSNHMDNKQHMATGCCIFHLTLETSVLAGA